MSLNIGNTIKKLRKELNLTQEELADQIHVTSQAVSKWENGTGLPDISQVAPLARTLKVSADVLLDIIPDTNDEIDKIIQNIVKNIRNETPDDNIVPPEIRTIWHEGRIPLDVIIAMVNIHKSTNDIDRKNYCVEKIDDAAKHLLGVINDMLDIFKIKAGKLTLTKKPCNIREDIERLNKITIPRINDKKQKFYLSIAEDIPETIIADGARLFQVIMNLLVNAVKFTYPEKGEIFLSAEKISEDDKSYTLKFSVRDTGIGISEEQQKNLFIGFIGNDYKGRFGGAGFGLVIAKHIVEMMDGEISVESEPGKGSAFTFTIMADKPEDKNKIGND